MAEATIAMLLLERVVRLGSADPFGYFRSHWPRLDQPVIKETSDEVITFEIPSATGFIGEMDMQIPDVMSEEDPGEPHPGLMQVAWDIVRKHQAHAIVGIASDRLAGLERAKILTRWVVSIAEACDALGVYWGNGSVVLPREQFRDFANELEKDPLPLLMWVRFAIERQPDGSRSLETTGLRELGCPEIEIDSEAMDSADLFDYAASFAHYVLIENRDVSDGDTFGFSEEDKVLVRHKPTADGKGFTYQLIFGKRTQ